MHLNEYYVLGLTILICLIICIAYLGLIGINTTSICAALLFTD